MIDKEGVMTKEFYEALTTAFTFFDKDCDGVFSPKELDAFYQTVNGEPIDKETVSFLRKHFHKVSAFA